MKLKLSLLLLLTTCIQAVMAMEPRQLLEQELVSASSGKNIEELCIIDSEGTEFNLNKNLSHALLKCESLSSYADFERGTIDFSGLKNRTFISKEHLCELADLIHRLDVEDAEPDFINLELFELATYLAAPEKVLFVLANRLWPEIQHDPVLSEFQNAYKKDLRTRAEPYLACPEHLLLFLNKNNISPNVIIVKHRDLDYVVKANLSFDNILNISNLNSHDTLSDTYLTQYKFCTLRGLSQLIEYLSPDKKNHAFHRINLSNHNLKTFSIKELQSTCKCSNHQDIILDNNNISKLSSHEIDSLEASYTLHLNNNPIEFIDNNFFEAMRKARSQNLLLYGGNARFRFILKNTALSFQKRKEYQKKFYEVTHTIPERFASPNIFQHGSFWLPAVLSGYLAATQSHKLFDNYGPIKHLAATGAGFFAGGIAGQYAMGYVISKIAQKTHPGISNFNMAMVQGSERFTLELD